MKNPKSRDLQIQLHWWIVHHFRRHSRILRLRRARAPCKQHASRAHSERAAHNKRLNVGFDEIRISAKSALRALSMANPSQNSRRFSRTSSSNDNKYSTDRENTWCRGGDRTPEYLVSRPTGTAGRPVGRPVGFFFAAYGGARPYLIHDVHFLYKQSHKSPS